MRDFYGNPTAERSVCYGPFIRLSADIQELSICCLYYFSFMNCLLLESLVLCCLCHDLEPHILFGILEVLHSAFRAGHIEVVDYISFLVTLISRFQVYREETYIGKRGAASNRGTFRSVTSVVCSSLSQIGDDYLVFQMMEKIIVDQICVKQPVDNMCAFLRLLIALDSKPTRLSEHSIKNISCSLAEYLIDIESNIRGEDRESDASIGVERKQYYILPSFFLFHRSNSLLVLVLNVLGSRVSEICSLLGIDGHTSSTTDCSSRLNAIISIILQMLKDVKLQRILLSCEMQIKCILQNMSTQLSSSGIKLTLGERHKIQGPCDRLKVAANKSFVGADDLGEMTEELASLLRVNSNSHNGIITCS